MRDFNISRRSSDTVAVFTPCPIHCQGYRRPIFPTGLATDTAPGLATDAQARRNISHYQFIVNTAGCLLSQLSQRIWGAPVCTGTTGGGGAPVRRRAHPQSSFPRQREGGDGFPSPRERRTHPQSSFPRRESAGAGGWVPVSTGTTAPGRRRESTATHGHPWVPVSIVIPATAGGRRWVPVSTGTTDAPNPSSFPRRESMAGGRRGWVPVSTGTTDGTHIAIPATAGIHGGGPGDGFPSPRERRWAALR